MLIHNQLEQGFGIRDDQKRVKKGAYDAYVETQSIRRRLPHASQPGHRRGSAHVAHPYSRNAQTAPQTVAAAAQPAGPLPMMSTSNRAIVDIFHEPVVH